MDPDVFSNINIKVIIMVKIIQIIIQIISIKHIFPHIFIITMHPEVFSQHILFINVNYSTKELSLL